MRSYIISVFVFFVSFFLSVVNGFAFQDNRSLIQFETRDSMALPVGSLLPGGFTGLCDGTIIVAGGSRIIPQDEPTGLPQYTDSIFALSYEGEAPDWRLVGQLPIPVAHAAGITYGESLILAGGQSATGALQKVWEFRWDTNQDRMVLDRTWPDLPIPFSNHAVAILGDWLYVAGYREEQELREPEPMFFRLNLKDGERWENLLAWPDEGRGPLSLIKQNNGTVDCLYLIAEASDPTDSSRIYSFNQTLKDERDRWEEVSGWDGRIKTFSSGAVGQSQILVVGQSSYSGAEGAESVKDEIPQFDILLSFNAITKSWYRLLDLTAEVAVIGTVVKDNQVVLFTRTENPGLTKEQALVISIERESRGKLAILDYLAIFGYLILMVGLGWYYSRKNKTSDDYFLGGQKIPFWAAGLSLMATQASAIGFMAIPAKSFMTNWSYFAGVFTWFIAVPIVIYAFVPFYRKLNVTSVYEYLDKRFNKFIRSFVAVLYLLFQIIGRLGAIIYLPSIALAAVTGLDVLVCVLMIGVLATVYTVLGGMYAVIWTDVIQSFVLFGGIIFCIGYVFFTIDASFPELLDAVSTDHKFSLGSMDLDLTMAVFWVIIVGNIFNRVATLSTDQSMVQRYMTTSSEKETRKALWTTVFVSIPWAILVFGLGTALYLFYKFNPGMMHPLVTADEIVPFFIAQNLPVGIRGVVIAGIFAAAMSSVDSSIHSSTTVVIRDFLQRNAEAKDEMGKVGMARYITVLFGVIGTGVAIFMTYLNISSVWDLILEVIGFFAGAMTGVFVLGIFTTKANGKGAAIGVVLSAVAVLYVQNFTDIHFFLYSGIGIIACVVLGYFSSFLFPSEKPIQGLTIYTIKK